MVRSKVFSVLHNICCGFSSKHSLQRLFYEKLTPNQYCNPLFIEYAVRIGICFKFYSRGSSINT